MMFMLMLTSTIISMSFMFMKHPLSMGFNLLAQSIVVSLITGFINYNFWYSYVLFLIMVGGMLVLFIYMTSIASNEKFESPNKIIMYTSIMTIMIMTFYIISDNFPLYQNFNALDLNSKTTFIMWESSLNKYLNYPSSIILLTLITYLFITLIAIVKITDSSYGALRQKL